MSLVDAVNRHRNLGLMQHTGSMNHLRQFFGVIALLFLGDLDAVGQERRLNQIQTIGSHNSYHLAPPQEVLTFLSLIDRQSAEALDYSHRPLVEQFEHLQVRQIELDLYADPQGGLFSEPIAYQKEAQSGSPLQRDPNHDGVLDQPGLKVLHSPDFDYRTTVSTFVNALREVKQWSSEHPRHLPILVLVELKETAVGPVRVKPVRFDADRLDEVDQEIRSVFLDSQMIVPDQIRGDYRSLREAISKQGWPKLEDCLGRVWFALDNEGRLRDLYLTGHPSLKRRVMFVSVGMNQPASAFLKINDPVRQFDQIQKAVRAGFIVRTRADAATVQARQNDTSRRDRAFASGAQYISTDYPEADQRLSGYQVRLPKSAEYRRNPVLFPK